jgi:hypothetical protein
MSATGSWYLWWVINSSDMQPTLNPHGNITSILPVPA